MMDLTTTQKIREYEMRIKAQRKMIKNRWEDLIDSRKHLAILIRERAHWKVQLRREKLQAKLEKLEVT